MALKFSQTGTCSNAHNLLISNHSERIERKGLKCTTL